MLSVLMGNSYETPQDTPEFALDYDAAEFDPGPLEALTVEQIAVYELYSQGWTREEIARRRHTDQANISEVLRAGRQVFQSDKATATLAMLKGKKLVPSAEEIEESKAISYTIAPVFKRVLGALVMAGTYEEAAKQLDQTAESVRVALEDAATDMQVHVGFYNASQMARFAFTARLDEYYEGYRQLWEIIDNAPGLESIPGEPFLELVTEFEVEPEAVVEEEQLSPAQKANIASFLGWMYPNGNPEDAKSLDDEQLKRAAGSIAEAAEAYVMSMPRGKRSPVRPSVKYIQKYLAGKDIASIAAAAEKNDATIRFALEILAPKLGQVTPLDRLLEQAPGQPNPAE